MRIQSVCLLLVLLSATVLSQDPKIKRKYKKFQNNHINRHMDVDGCDDVMRAKKMARINNCKKKNTFILSKIGTVRAVCVNKGEPDGDMTKSLQRFHLVFCTFKCKQTRRPNCHYNGEKLYKKIIIKCEEGFPVHYDGDIGHCEN